LSAPWSPGGRWKAWWGRIRQGADAAHPAPPPDGGSALADAAVAERRRALASDALSGARGIKEYVSLEPVSSHYGERWPQLVNRAKILADAVLRHALGPHDFYVEDGDAGFHLVFNDPDATPEAIAHHAERVRAEILTVLIGGEDLPDEDAAPEAAAAAAPEDTPPPDAELHPPRAAVVREAYVEAGDGTEDAEPERAADWRRDAVADTRAEFGASEAKAAAAPVVIESTDARTDDAAAESSGDHELSDLAVAAEADATPAGIDAGRSETRSAPNADLPASAARIDPDPATAAPPIRWRDAESTIATSGEPEVDPRSAPNTGDRAEVAADPTAGLAGAPDAALDTATSDDRPVSDGVIETVPAAESSARAFDPSGERIDAAVSAVVQADPPPAVGTAQFSAPADRVAADAAVSSADRSRDTAADVATSNARGEPGGLFAPSADLADAAFDVAATGERDADGPLPASSAERGESAPALADSATRPDQTRDVASTGDRIHARLEPARADERPAGVTATSIALDLVPPLEAAFGTSHERADVDTDWGASGLRATPGAIIARVEDRVEGVPATAIAGERDERDPGVAASGTRGEPGLEVGQSATRADRAAVEVPESTERSEPAAAYAATGERPAHVADVSRSESQLTAAADVDATAERAGGGGADWGGTRERASSAHPVAESAERTVATPALAASTDKPIDTVAMIRERSYDPTLLTNITLRYTAFWDVKRQVVSTYVLTPIKCDDGVRIDSPFDLITAARSDSAANALDLMLLERAIAAASTPIRRGARFVLALPISAATLSRPRLRARYLAAWAAVPDPVRQQTRLVCHHLDAGIADATLTEVVLVMRQLARAPMLQLSWRANLLPRLGGHGVDAVGLDLSELGELEWAEVDRSLFSAVARAHTHGIKVFVSGLADRSVARKVLSVDVDFLAGGVIESLDALPVGLTQASRELYLDGLAAPASDAAPDVSAGPSARP
jgi:EAL domain-containing protein (putative c-di-GMP-specific phosphodiesterase class I)